MQQEPFAQASPVGLLPSGLSDGGLDEETTIGAVGVDVTDIEAGDLHLHHCHLRFLSISVPAKWTSTTMPLRFQLAIYSVRSRHQDIVTLVEAQGITSHEELLAININDADLAVDLSASDDCFWCSSP